jgi:hypothetical protein
MIHNAVRRQLPLLLYGELTGWRAAALRRHLQRCQPCRMDYEELLNLHQLVTAAGSEPMPEAIIDEARQRMLRGIASGREQPQPAGFRFTDPLSGLLPVLRRHLAGATRVLAGAAVGFLLAAIFWPSNAEQGFTLEGLPPEQVRIENVRFLGDEPEGKELELTLEAFRPVQVRGSVDDPAIQRLLAQALLSERNAGVRLRAVSVLRAPNPDVVDPEIRRALLAAMTTDENAGVRMAALEAVRQLPLDHESRDALLHVILYDVNPGLRIAAINALETFVTDFTREDDAALRDRMDELESDENAYVRWKARTVLLERGAL